MGDEPSNKKKKETGVKLGHVISEEIIDDSTNFIFDNMNEPENNIICAETIESMSSIFHAMCQNVVNNTNKLSLDILENTVESVKMFLNDKDEYITKFIKHVQINLSNVSLFYEGKMITRKYTPLSMLTCLLLQTCCVNM